MAPIKRKWKIVVTDATVKVDKLKEIGTVLQYDKDSAIPRDVLLEWGRDADALFCLLRDRIDKELLDKCPQLKVIGTMSVGYEHIDVEECRRRSIKVGYTPDVLTEATAELCVGLLLATSRRLFEANQAARNGEWTIWKPYFMQGKQISGSTIGIYGLGKVGLSIAQKLSAFQPSRILYNNRTKREDVNYTYVSFEELLRESDFLIVSASANPNNKQIFNKHAFEQMKRDAIFCNIGRGVLVDTNDLYNALKDGKIHAAGLDVMDPEPLPPKHPLFTLKNCVILPHIGSATYKTRDLMASVTVENIFNALNDQKMVAALIE